MTDRNQVPGRALRHRAEQRLTDRFGPVPPPDDRAPKPRPTKAALAASDDARRVLASTQWLVPFNVLFTIAGIIGGIVFATVRVDTTTCIPDPLTQTPTCSTDTSHPYVGAGIGVCAAALMFGLLVELVARYARMHAHEVFARHLGQ